MIIKTIITVLFILGVIINWMVIVSLKKKLRACENALLKNYLIETMNKAVSEDDYDMARRCKEQIERMDSDYTKGK